MYRIGLENNAEGRSQAWVLEHPGCFAYGVDGPAALGAVPQAIQDYRSWVAVHTPESWLPGENDLEYRLEETWEAYTIGEGYEIAKEGYEVNAWFRNDWKPLTEEDIRRGLLLLSWQRDDLLKIVAALNPDVLQRTYPQERWSIAGILNHIGGAEWWYLSRLGLSFERKDLPSEPFDRLDKIRTHLVELLPGLAGSTQVVGIEGEFWSPRKLLRRIAWHESDHIAHIRKLL